MNPSSSSFEEASTLQIDQKRLIRGLVKKTLSMKITRNKPKEVYASNLSEIGLPSQEVQEQAEGAQTTSK